MVTGVDRTRRGPVKSPPTQVPPVVGAPLPKRVRARLRAHGKKGSTDRPDHLPRRFCDHQHHEPACGNRLSNRTAAIGYVDGEEG